MPTQLQGPLSLLGRVLLCLIFISSAAMNKIPKFGQVAQYMESAGVPVPQVALAGAIVFLLVGGVLVVIGYKARLGALLLLIFLALATYFFHAFWTIDDPAKQQEQAIQAMKNLAMAGAMVFIIANGPGAWSLERTLAKE